jgi:VIT1/CCC1 family predicted Fe2+/Mn2+ transporter
MNIDERLLDMQRSEVTEQKIYERLAELEKNPENSEVLRSIARDEGRHAGKLRERTGKEVSPDRLKVAFFVILARLAGVTFTLRLMESGETSAQDAYAGLAEEAPELADIAQDEREHEDQLLEMLDDGRMRYVGSIVLGLNDALVELTGAIAGLTLALNNTSLIAMVGLITGISASLSMAASEYLASKKDPETGKKPLKAAAFTGVSYITAVIVLIIPFLVLNTPLAALGWTLGNALGLIFLFTFYSAVARKESMRDGFFEMAGISMGVAAVSFGIGLVVRQFLGVDV